MRIRSKLKNRARRAVVGNLERRLDDVIVLAGRLLVEQVATRRSPDRLADCEFKVFSQFGEDGIIAYLTSHVSPVQESFIEFGVGDYSESNTRFILECKNWRGLVIEASEADVATIRHSELYWKHDLTALHSFVTRENINTLIADSGFAGGQGILSIDIDGNDYWIWEAVSEVDPAIVIVEYNALWGGERAVTIPYDASFDRIKAHHSGLYFGASIRALCLLAERKGYVFVGSNSHGTNAFFVRQDLGGDLNIVSAEDAYVGLHVRQGRDRSGTLTRSRHGIRALRDLPLVDVRDGSWLTVGDLGDNG